MHAGMLPGYAAMRQSRQNGAWRLRRLARVGAQHQVRCRCVDSRDRRSLSSPPALPVSGLVLWVSGEGGRDASVGLAFARVRFVLPPGFWALVAPVGGGYGAGAGGLAA